MIQKFLTEFFIKLLNNSYRSLIFYPRLINLKLSRTTRP